MPDPEANKPGNTPSPPDGAEAASVAGSDSAPAPLSLEDELDRLLEEINVAVEELDPCGDLENAAANARNAAVVGDPDYDEIEDMFEVVLPSAVADENADNAEKAETQSQAPPSPQPESPAESATLEDELDELIDEAESASATERSQIDDELDALLAEAGTLLGADRAPVVPESEPESPVEPAAETQQEPAEQPETEPEGVAAPPEPDAPEAKTPAEAEQPETEPGSGAEAPEGAGRSIEDIDADLAERAEAVAKEEPEPAIEAEAPGEDAFQSSEDVVEQVIDEHASAVESDSADDADDDQKNTDDLAQLMAESPASSSVAVDASAPESRTAPKADTAPAKAADKSQAVSAPPSPKPGARAAKAPEEKASASRFAAVGRAARVVRPVALRVARVLAKPLELVPHARRDDIGWLASVTMFLAIVVMVALALFR